MQVSKEIAGAAIGATNNLDVAKVVSGAIVGPDLNYLDIGKVIAGAVIISDINFKAAKVIAGVVIEMKQPGFVCVACC